MLPILSRRFAALEHSRAAMLAQVSSLSGAQSKRAPAEGKWSAAQLISHIAKTEAGILRTVTKQLRDPQPVRPGDRFGALMVRSIMRSPLKLKVPQEASHIIPEPEPELDTAIADWNRAREHWRTLLEKATGPMLKGGVFKHPRGGWFTLPQTVLFLRLHHDHHRAQLKRIRKAINEAA